MMNATVATRWKACPPLASVRRNVLSTVVFTLLLISGAQSSEGASSLDNLASLPALQDASNDRQPARTTVVGGNQLAGVLRLPDASVVRTVWPAALEVNSRELGGEPVWPRCEPAVYSLARIAPDGRQLWAKSYIYRNDEFRKFEACDAARVGYVIHSSLAEVTSPDYYLRSTPGRFYVRGRSEEAPLVIDIATGDVIDNGSGVPLKVVDAVLLRDMKEEIVRDISPAVMRAAPERRDEVRARALFDGLEERLFGGSKR